MTWFLLESMNSLPYEVYWQTFFKMAERLKPENFTEVWPGFFTKEIQFYNAKSVSRIYTFPDFLLDFNNTKKSWNRFSNIFA